MLVVQNSERVILLNQKEKNRIKNATKSSSLLLFDKNIKIRDTPIDDVITNNITSCTPTTQKFLEVFMSSASYKKKFLLDKIDSDSLAIISKLCQSCSENYTEIGNVIIRTVLGAVEHIPFRALSYLLPAVRMVEALLEQQKLKKAKNIFLPQIEFVFMLKIGVSLNGLNYETCRNEILLFIKVAKKYLATYHPEVNSKVKFLVDDTFTSTIRKNKEYQNYEAKVTNLLKSNTNISSILTIMGSRHGHADNSFEYASMHPLLHDGIVDSNVASFTECDGTKHSMNKEVSTIISIGARPEEEFWKVRKLINDNFRLLSFITPIPVVQYIAQMNVPPYSPLDSGELYLDDVIQNPKLVSKAKPKRGHNEWSEYQTPVQKSVHMIIEDTYGDEDELIEFLSSFQNNLKKNL